MKAVVFEDKEKLMVKDIPAPVPAEGEALVKISFSGICGSDVHIFSGHHPTATFPLVPGHEFVGTLEAVHKKTVLDIPLGTRVTAEPLISCGHCDACTRGHYHVCAQLKLLGIHKAGSFAEYMSVPAKKLIAVPETLPDSIAVLTEPFAVGFHVNERGNVRNGDNVLIIGGGPIGLIIGMVAIHNGADRVVFSEINDRRKALIEEFGFELLDNPANNLKDNFDVVFEVSGSESGINKAVSLARIRGTIVNVGFFASAPSYDAMKVIFRELTIKGSRVYSFQHFERTVTMLNRIYASNKFPVEKLISNNVEFDSFPSAMDEMVSGKNLGKIIVKI